ncbi:MAG: OmpA family protein [Deltaproteobacteria bacterium]|nr:OmpA family protein [Deltaproteobacteria bacterium]
MKKILLILSLILLLAFTTAANAEMKAGAFSVTPFIGGYLFQGEENLKDPLIYGLRFGSNITRHWGFEGVFYYGQSENKALAGNPDVDLYSYGVEALYNFMPGSKFVPFLAAGGGGSLLHESGVGTRSHRGMLDYGGGLKYFVTEDIALRADVRHVIPLNESNNNLLFTFGVNFFFGGVKKAAPVVETARAAEPAAAPVVVAPPPPPPPPAPAPEPLPPPPPPPPPVVEKAAPPASAMEKSITEKGRVTLNVEFDFGKATIRKGEQADIAQLADVMKKYPDLKITIEGHTDNVGNAKYNEKLSLQRANAVKKNLVDKYGIAASRLDTKGYGMTKPIASNKTKEGRQKNRRVEASAEYLIKK